ncbi:hypothetical protein PHLH8_10420 [Pseudomonas sp. Pc102]|uniref:SMI1/KNR4 family protein n=1 Tax=Pseudomonas sp. Pc102 TaxID=2678261 RepID=UPI001BCF9D41|nr:SMI1/KNR4 family protein [Pseudomonas sp. Pc102]BBP81400.1 hypothetical protein PHLH8_10420 [Pseudomonas sp. Pc102]
MFTHDELQRLRQHELAPFAGRIIHQARPPITDAELAEVEARLGRALPPSLVRLWRVAYGGRLDYDFQVDYQGHLHAFSLSELFFPGSDGYNDLWGWIEHEEEGARAFAEHEGREWDGRLAFLPVGGFEYLERIYVRVEPGEDFGAVYAWSQGLPPAWSMRLHEDSFTRVADDFEGLFAQLVYYRDPFEEGADGTGLELDEALDPLAIEDAALAQRLRAGMSALVQDWRGALDDGRLSVEPALQRLALEHAVEHDDEALLARLAGEGVDLGQLIRGGVNAPVYARLLKREALLAWFAGHGIAERHRDQ